MEAVAGVIDHCGSKSDAKRQGERDKRDHNPKVATVTTNDDKWRQVATNKIANINCLPHIWGVEGGSQDTQFDNQQLLGGSCASAPIVILALYVKNVFNSLTQQHLSQCRFRQEGLQLYTPSERVGEDKNTPVGWDLFLKHIQILYWCEEIIKYYHWGEVQATAYADNANLNAMAPWSLPVAWVRLSGLRISTGHTSWLLKWIFSSTLQSHNCMFQNGCQCHLIICFITFCNGNSLSQIQIINGDVSVKMLSSCSNMQST